MASEYLEYLNRDVKPEVPPHEMTPKEKRKNWWHYHWKMVAVIAVAVAAAVSMILHNLGVTEPVVDYQVAYVGSERLSDETVEELTDFFESQGEDASGDGKVTVSITQYVFYENTDDYDYAQLTMSASAALESDILTQSSYFFLMDNPEGMMRDYELLAGAEGNLPAEGDFSWEDKVMPLTQVMEDAPPEASELYLGRRGFYDEDHVVKYKDACDRLWEKLITFAVRRGS